MAPNPSGPLHIGHSRMAILNDEYVKRYGGICYNRFEDTDPARVDPSGYDSIPADFDWLGVKIHRTIIQSDRFEIYYDIAKKLLDMGKAYVCTCRPEDLAGAQEQEAGVPAQGAAAFRADPPMGQDVRRVLQARGGLARRQDRPEAPQPCHQGLRRAQDRRHAASPDRHEVPGLPSHEPGGGRRRPPPGPDPCAQRARTI